MQSQTVERLLALNREFYATVAEPFNQTRYAESPGKQRLISLLAPQLQRAHVRVLDVGCGNGRLAWMLERLGRPLAYTGVDGEAQLLALAAANTATLAHVHTRWHVADLADPQWHWGLTHATATHAEHPPNSGNSTADTPETGYAVEGYDVVVCLATLQHMPGLALRGRLVTELGRLLAPHGRLAISAWQFLTSPRLAAKQLPWHTVGLDADQVEPGDALLPWQQEQYAVRYVHQIDPTEMARLAAHAGLALETAFFADGREGNLNYYALMRRADG